MFRRFLGVGVLCSVGCGVPPLELTATNVPDLLDEAVEEGLPGIIVYVDRPGEDDDFLGAAGEANRATAERLEPDARFRVASNTKSFVGLAAAALHEDGVLDLDAPASQWLDPEVSGRIENAGEATLRQLLNHTAGTYDYLANDDFWAAVDAEPGFAWTIADGLAYAIDQPADFPVGDGWAYSNTNYLLAGLVIESATGRSWGDVVRDEVLVSWGLEDSWVEGIGEPTGPIVHGYTGAYGGYDDMFDVNTGYGLPDGGLVSTAEDLGMYVRALATEAGPLEAASATATGMRVETGGDDTYGLGVSHWANLQGVEAWGHGGNLEGYSSEMFYFPASDTTLVVLANGSDGDLDEVFEAVVDRAISLVVGE